MTLGRRWLEGAVSRVTEKVTAWTEDERREMAEQKERDNYDAYERDEHGNKLRVTVGRCEKSGNPCGTDTWVVGQSCPCKPCQAWLDAHPEAREVRLPDPCAPWKPEPPDSNDDDDVLAPLRKVTTGGGT